MALEQRRSAMRGIISLLVKVILVFSGIMLILSPRVRIGLARDSNEGLDRLLLIVKLMAEEDAEFFNRVLKEKDIVFTYGFKRRLLGRIKGPQIMFSRGSLRQIREELKKVKGVSLDYINYNPEQWKESHTPREEIDNLPETVKKVKRLAQQRGLRLSFATDHILLERYGDKIAPLVDLFGIQMQRYQRDPLKEFCQEARRKLAIVRRGSREVPVVFQLSLAPPKWKIVRRPNGEIKRVYLRDRQGRKILEPLEPEVVLRQIEAIRDIADGIALIYTQETREDMKRLLHLLRD